MPIVQKVWTEILHILHGTLSPCQVGYLCHLGTDAAHLQLLYTPKIVWDQWLSLLFFHEMLANLILCFLAIDHFQLLVAHNKQGLTINVLALSIELRRPRRPLVPCL